MVQLPWQRREIQLHRKRGAEKAPLRKARLIRPLLRWFYRERGISISFFLPSPEYLTTFIEAGNTQALPLIYSIKVVITLIVTSRATFMKRFRQFFVVRVTVNNYR